MNRSIVRFLIAKLLLIEAALLVCTTYRRSYLSRRC